MTPALFNDERLPPRFWAKVCVNAGTGCWEWIGGKRRRGYGRYGSGADQRAAHRVAYEALVATIPPGLQLDHLCRVPHCVNPAHLEPVTHQENARRGLIARTIPEERARSQALQAHYDNEPPRVPANSLKTHCPQGHEYAGDNLYTSPRGGRVCRRCHSTQNAILKKAARSRLNPIPRRYI